VHVVGCLIAALAAWGWELLSRSGGGMGPAEKQFVSPRPPQRDAAKAFLPWRFGVSLHTALTLSLNCFIFSCAI